MPWILDIAGYMVITACNGFEALEIFRRRKEEIGFVLFELRMPGMNGWETLAAIPVILTCGFDESRVMRGDHPERAQMFPQKPCQSRGFQMAIKASLRGASRTTENA